MKKAFILVFFVVLAVALAGCAAGANEVANVENPEGKVAGFWQGLWHGVITPVTFVISLFNARVSMYEVHNNGGWYDFGYLLGVITVFGGGGGGAGRRSRKG